MSSRRSRPRARYRRRRHIEPFFLDSIRQDASLSLFILPIVSILACILATGLIRTSISSQAIAPQSRQVVPVAVRKNHPALSMIMVASFDEPPRPPAPRSVTRVIGSVLQDNPPAQRLRMAPPVITPLMRVPGFVVTSLQRGRTLAHGPVTHAFTVADAVTSMAAPPIEPPTATRTATPTATRSSTPSPTATPRPQPTVVHLAQVWITGYSLSGATATGAPAGPGVCAVDPSYIPLGTRITIDGIESCVAEDTGPTVIGAHIDVWVPTDGAAYSITGWYTARW